MLHAQSKHSFIRKFRKNKTVHDCDWRKLLEDSKLGKLSVAELNK